jgi:hypothetical protein
VDGTTPAASMTGRLDSNITGVVNDTEIQVETKIRLSSKTGRAGSNVRK